MNKQTEEQLNEFYTTPDPWGYQTHPDDTMRKQAILGTLAKYGEFDKGLDLGAGEGWITADLPAKVKCGYELSDVAASRFPKGVKRVKKLSGKYDLIVACGVLYKEYEVEALLEAIKKHAGRIVLTCNIEGLEVNTLDFKVLEEFTFPYREYVEHLVIYEVPTAPQRGKRTAQQLQHKGGNTKRTKKRNTDV